jgi:Xaa-Pro dipeptidase
MTMPIEITPITAKPPREELERRMARVRKAMAAQALDCYICANTENVYYLTNFAYIPFERPFFLVIPAAGRPVMVAPKLEVSHAADRVLVDVAYHTYDEFPAPPGRTFVDALKKLVPADRAVGIESSLSLALKEAMPGKLRVLDLVDDLRMVKSAYEIGRIAYAASVAESGLKTALDLARPGVQQLTIYTEGTRAMLGRVLLEIPNPNLLVTKAICAVWPKALSAQPHSTPGLFDAFTSGGPNVVIVTIQADGYSAEVERTFFMETVPDAARKPWAAMMEARALAFARIRPGVRAAEVDEVVLALIRKHGYGENILHRTGHGFGITGHEPPWVALGSDTVLEPNMVVSVEPGIYLRGLGGFRHSDTVLVTEDGCVPLTAWSDRLEDLILPGNA